MRTPNRRVELRPVRCADVVWLTVVGLDPEKIGRQYHWYELVLQPFVAPARALFGPRRPARVVEVDGRRAGYIGPNPLSGNLEYFLQPWARGGTGTTMVADYLRDHRQRDRARRFYVAGHNTRSLRTLLRAFEQLGWVEDRDFWIRPGPGGRLVHVRAG